MDGKYERENYALKAEWYHTRAARWALAAGVALAALAGCGGRPKVKLPPPRPAVVGASEVGMASWYGHPYHGRTTSNGEVYDMHRLTAAHLSLPFHTWVRVTNYNNGRFVDVRINDRGPFKKKRVIDLSYEAARRIEMIGPGTARVRVMVMAPPGVAYRGEPERPVPAPVVVETRTELVVAQGCPPGPYYAVQVGSFRDRLNAEETLEEMTARYGSAWVLEVDSGGARLYRVVVGPAADHPSAERLRTRLAGEDVNGFVLLVSARDAAGCLGD